MKDIVGLDWHSLLIQAISFLITLWVLKRLLWVPVLNHLANRAQEIQSDYTRAEDERRKMEGLRREYEERVKAADEEARSRVQAVMANANAQAERVRADAQAEARALLERARAEIEQDRQRVMAELRAQVAHLSVVVAGKIIDEHLDEARHRTLVDSFINQLGSLS